MKHLLVHNEPKAVKTSTAALETPEVVTKRSAMEFSSEQYAVQEGTSAWQPVSSDIMKNSLHHCIASKAYEEKNQYPIEVEAKEAGDVQREALMTKQAQSDALNNEREENEAVMEEQHPLPKQAQSNLALLDQQYIQVREEMGEEGVKIKLKNASFIHLLDTGGQPSFQDVLPLLLDVPCTYIQVFNASRSLYERVPVTYRPNDHTEVSLGDAECGRDMMLRSFSSMHTMSQKYSKELATFRQKNSPPPQLRIFVVGTHKDELIAQGRLDEATKEIKTFLETLKGKPYYNSIQWDSKGQKFYVINALSVNDRVYVNDLRERISSEGFLKLDVPLMWFICQEVTRCTPKKFFRLQDLESFCRKHHFVDGENAASQFRALLQLLTLLGFYAFFDLEDVPDEANFVCTDRGVFLREVSTLLAVQLHAECVHLLDTVRDGLSLSAKAVLGSNFGNVAELAVGFECPCKEVGMDHLAVPSETGKSLECLEKDSKQDFSNKQRIWFFSLAGVHGVEVSICTFVHLTCSESSCSSCGHLSCALRHSPCPHYSLSRMLSAEFG